MDGVFNTESVTGRDTAPDVDRVADAQGDMAGEQDPAGAVRFITAHAASHEHAWGVVEFAGQ